MPGPHPGRPHLRWKGLVPSEGPTISLSKGTNLLLEGPGVTGLLIELPVGLAHRRRTHQAIGIQIFDRLGTLPADDELSHPFGIDTGIDHQMRNVDVAGTEPPRHRLPHGAEPNFCGDKSPKP